MRNTDQDIHGPRLEVVVKFVALFSRDVYETREPFSCLALAVVPQDLM
jgi:hypothetical protein